jgi:hypothetical protein
MLSRLFMTPCGSRAATSNGKPCRHAAPLQDIQQAAGYVRQNLREVSWLMISLMFAAGLIVALMLGYWPMRSSQNNMQEQLNRIEQYLAAQQQGVPAPAAPDVHASAHREKRSRPTRRACALPRAGYGFDALRAWNADEARVPQTHSLDGWIMDVANTRGFAG